MRVNAVRHKRRHGARSVVLANIAGALQIIEDLLVNIAEVLAFSKIVRIHLVDFVNDLAHRKKPALKRLASAVDDVSYSRVRISFAASAFNQEADTTESAVQHK